MDEAAHCGLLKHLNVDAQCTIPHPNKSPGLVCMLPAAWATQL